MICCICSRDREAAKVITLTEEEKRAVKKLTKDVPPDTYAYCHACWAVATDRNQGAQLFKGLMQAGLNRTGVHNANGIAIRYYRFLVDHAAKKPVS